MLTTTKAPLNVHRKYYLLVATCLILLTISAITIIICTYTTKTEKPPLDNTIKIEDPFLEPKTSLENAIHVKTETELRAALTNAPNNTHITISLDKDITLTNRGITINANQDITLTSNKATGYYKLIGGRPTYNGRFAQYETIVVRTDGVLRLDGIIVTHAKGVLGEGVYVNAGGTLVLYAGVISGNNNPRTYMGHGHYAGNGGGVGNSGTFVMFGGEITDNTAYRGSGVSGPVERFGGKIYGNTDDYDTEGNNNTDTVEANNDLFYVVVCIVGVGVGVLVLPFKFYRRKML